MSRMKTLCAMESLVEDVPQINFVVCPAVHEDCEQIYELIQVWYCLIIFTLITFHHNKN